jgi:hypothetical protein
MTHPGARLIKILLHDHGEDGEWPWAEDLGPADGVPGGRLVRLDNVPFFFGKPTYGDVIVVALDPRTGALSWDRCGRTDEEVSASLHADSGRWPLALEYTLVDPSGDVTDAYRALKGAGESAGIIIEGAVAGQRGGIACLAVPQTLTVEMVFSYLQGLKLPVSLKICEDDEGL